MKKQILGVILWVLIIPAGNCWAGEDKAEDVLKLLTISGSLEHAREVVVYLTKTELEAMGEDEAEISPEAIAIIEEETIKILSGQFVAGSPLVSELVTIYSEFFTHDEIKKILAFYESEVGLKMIAAMPQIMERSMLAGQVMGNSITPLLRDNILLRLQREGIAVPH